jgi:DNA-binding NtrC family response regulator
MSLLCRDGPTAEDAPLPGMIGEHSSMKAVYRLVQRVAPTELPVLIVGETGTGKELVARALHILSPRSREPFIAVNAAALPESLFESELFGHEASAFSDAKVPKPGLLEEAHEGTLFCDELPSLSSVCQAKLLRAIEDGTVRRVGGLRSRPAAPRWVAACQRWGSGGRWAEGVREDLWQRIAAVVIALPRLRERQTDIATLAASFLAAHDDAGSLITEAALAALSHHDWPGNVRELRQVVTRLSLEALGNWS